MIHVLLDFNLALNRSLATPFRFCSGIPMSAVLDKSKFLKCLPSLQQHGIAFVDQLHNHHGAVFDWYTFKRWKNNFMSVHNCLSWAGSSSLSVYTDGSLSNLSTASCRADAATYFEDIGLSLGISVLGLMSSILAELQAIVLALEYVPSSSSVQLFSDSQSALDACKSELSLACPDFCNQCWIKHHHIVNVVHNKNLNISWHKVKGYSGVLGNKHADAITGAASFSDWFLLSHLNEHFLVADGSIIFGNSRHFVYDVYYSVCHVCWEVGSGFKFLTGSLLSEMNWLCLLLVRHPDLHMAAGFTSKLSADAHTYFMKALHYQLSIAVQKHLYNRLYSSVLCLYCGEVEVLDYVFFYKVDDSIQCYLLKSHINSWKMISGLSYFSLDVLQLLSFCVSNSSVSTALYKNFVFNGWFCKAVSIFHDLKIASLEFVKFVCSFGLAFRTDI
ncbi:hypothetical protein G9A89_000036 [Geosiphon pyriformis]|nr:hypothetical protein G9A89_000036 [Geosiphon pyriformis]